MKSVATMPSRQALQANNWHCLGFVMPTAMIPNLRTSMCVLRAEEKVNDRYFCFPNCSKREVKFSPM